MLWINKTKCPQIIDVPGSIFPATIHPGTICDLSAYRPNSYDREAFMEFKPEMFRNKKHVAFTRRYAMGDLIQLVPVVRHFQKHFNVNKITIVTMPDIVEQLSFLFNDIEWLPEEVLQYGTKAEVTANLDGIIERDHSLTNHERNLHRIFIYSDFIGLPRPSQQELNWAGRQFPLQFPMEKTNMKKIALQIRGSGRMKTLPDQTVKTLAGELSKKYKVFLIDKEASKGWDGKNIVNCGGKFTVHQLVAFLEKMDCVVTMDSGILWLAHAAKCPTLTVFGPTREEERLSLHPLYPEKAKGLSISKEIINCTPCFETQNLCGRQVHCMNRFDQVKFINLAMNRIQTIVGE